MFFILYYFLRNLQIGLKNTFFQIFKKFVKLQKTVFQVQILMF